MSAASLHKFWLALPFSFRQICEQFVDLVFQELQAGDDRLEHVLHVMSDIPWQRHHFSHLHIFEHLRLLNGRRGEGRDDGEEREVLLVEHAPRWLSTLGTPIGTPFPRRKERLIILRVTNPVS